MRLVRYGPLGRELPGLLDQAGEVRALSPLIGDFDATTITPEWLAMLATIDVERLPRVEGSPRFGVPVAGIRQIIAIGLNYRDHAEEAGMACPGHPMMFFKSIGSLAGANDPVAVPASAEKLDWEVELALLIGREARNVSVADALDHVAGYCTAVDVSERAWQLERGGSMSKGKSQDGFTPIGPWLVTADEVADPQALDLRLDLNGEARQRGRTADMIFSVAEIIADLSQYMTLVPGDLILTGTPAGVGLGMKPQLFMRPGDRFDCGIDGLGEQAHTVELRP